MDRISNLLFYAEQVGTGERGAWPAVALWSALLLTAISLAVGYWRTACAVWTHGGGAVVRELVGLFGLAAAGRGIRRWWTRQTPAQRIAELEARLKALEVEAAHTQHHTQHQTPIRPDPARSAPSAAGCALLSSDPSQRRCTAST